MRLLLDTRAFLWFVLRDSRIREVASALIADPDNDIEVSPASYREISIKISLKKYELQEPYEVFMERELATNQFRVLPIEPKHTAVLTSLPFHHCDPLDRLLVAQAMVEKIPLVSNDTALDAYPVQRLW